MPTNQTLIALLAAAALALSACGDDDAEGSATDSSAQEDGGGEAAAEAVDTVDIVDFEFTPESAIVEAGSEVTFTNADNTPHTATATDGEFNTDSIDGGGAIGSTTAPSEPGEYSYFCSFHPFMKGTLIVE